MRGPHLAPRFNLGRLKSSPNAERRLHWPAGAVPPQHFSEPDFTSDTGRTEPTIHPKTNRGDSESRNAHPTVLGESDGG